MLWLDKCDSKKMRFYTKRLYDFFVNLWKLFISHRDNESHQFMLKESCPYYLNKTEQIWVQYWEYYNLSYREQITWMWWRNILSLFLKQNSTSMSWIQRILYLSYREQITWMWWRNVLSLFLKQNSTRMSWIQRI